MTRTEMLRLVHDVTEVLDKYDDPDFATADEIVRLRRELKEANRSCEGECEFRKKAEQQRDVVQKQMGDLNEALCKRIAELERQITHTPLAATVSPDDTAAIKLAEAEHQIAATRRVLQVPDDKFLVDVAETRMTAIRDLVAKLDHQDREMAEALLGIFPGDDAVTSVKKLVAFYRAHKTSEAP